MKVLSFIIPSYNCEQFLEKCLTSFVDEKILDKLEIIVVNDGSTDNTAAVAEKYVELYPNSFRLISQENKGHGGALNSGCNSACGKYLKVIDADDWVVTENLCAFVEILEKIQTDVVLTHNFTTNITNGEIKKWMSYPTEFNKEYSISDVVSDWKAFARSFTFHGITYNTEFYKNAKFILSEHVFYEDHEFSTFPACFANSVMPLDIFVYNYRIGDEKQSVSDSNRIAKYNDHEMVLKRFISEHNNVPTEDKDVRTLICIKAKILLMSYLSTALLVDSNRKSGRQRSKAIMELYKSELPMAYRMALNQYRTFRVLHFFGIKKKTLDKFLNSKLYHKINGTRKFD